MASNSEQSSQQQLLSDHAQKSSSTRPSDIDNTSVSNTSLNMSDENRDPSSNPLPTKIRPKPVDARSAAASSLISSLDSPKSATITNVSQRLPSTSVEVSVGEILSTDEKRASVSIREQQKQQQPQQQSYRHSSSSCSSSELDDITENTFSTTNKMDLGEATRELTRLLHIGNDNTMNEIHLNPDAPDFTPIDFSPTYRSELAPAHLHRRATQVDYYNNRHSRSRYYSESYHHSVPTNTSTIRPLLSLVPQYIPYHRQSWSTTTPPPPPSASSSSNAWWQQQDYSNPSSSTSSYHSKPAYPLYSPLMPPLTDDSLYPNSRQSSSKRQRIHSSRAFVFPSQTTTNRKRSHSGPETPLIPPPTHLNGIHCLAKIMIDILRLIDPLPIKQEQKSNKTEISLSSSNFSSSSSQQQQRKYRRSSNNTYQQRRLQQKHDSIDAEDVFVDDEIATITSLIQKTYDTTNAQNKSVEDLIDNEQKPSLLLNSTDTDVKNTVHSPVDESSTNESTPVIQTTN
ncbi:unnamed protein product [Adineta steineri]|uniref:Uncharacterized protein n=1 Tax=Adineta steineri TaxID=433720 RepID=A0A815CZL1_9BILA|nr:unnamed protein product [Adineta steineri]CAF3970354.1 unnamed protein product [Adineta steineri]